MEVLGERFRHSQGRYRDVYAALDVPVGLSGEAIMNCRIQLFSPFNSGLRINLGQQHGTCFIIPLV
jgi:hypothetical protein